jgi:CYTH domain-containing protein
LIGQKTHKYAWVERERRFWLAALPPGLSLGDEHTLIEDRYIEGARLRLRKMTPSMGGETALKFGQKYVEDGQEPHQTVMTNLYLDQTEYDLLGRLPAKVLTKKRYGYPYQERKLSIDVFMGNLEGLILAEIEFLEDSDAANFPAPSFALRDVTDEHFFTGGELVKLTAAEFGQWKRENLP